MDNGAKKVLIPLPNERDFFEVPGEIVEKVDPIFYFGTPSSGTEGGRNILNAYFMDWARIIL